MYSVLLGKRSGLKIKSELSFLYDNSQSSRPILLTIVSNLLPLSVVCPALSHSPVPGLLLPPPGQGPRGAGHWDGLHCSRGHAGLQAGHSYAH